MTTSQVLGIDVGGTRIKAGLVAADGTLSHARVLPTESHAGPEALLATLLGIIASVPRPLAVGVGLTGGVDPDVGVVRLPGKIHGLEGFPLIPRLRFACGLPVWGDNDGRLALLAEMAHGALRHRRWAVLLTIGTGIGSGVLLDGRVLRDPGLMFGTQVGHLQIDSALQAPLCLTGARGTAEIGCSATALVQAVANAQSRGISTSAPSHADFRMVVNAAMLGDALCQDELSRWTDRLGLYLVSVIHAYAPEVVVLGGGAVAAAPAFLPRVQELVDRHVFIYPADCRVPILASAMPDHAGVIGAAVFAAECLGASR